MAVIEMKGVTKSYGKIKALKGLDLIVEEGGIYGFIGMNGAGKSTTIRILLGMLKPDSGQVRLLSGDPFTDCVELHKRIAYVPSEINPWGNLSGGEMIDLLVKLRGKADKKRISDLIERFQFDPSKKCRSYSKGNRQKTALISALACDVELYLLDEPTSGLDPLMELVFQDYVKELASEGRTVFLSSHILSEVERLCESVSIIKDGMIVESGRLKDMSRFSHLCVTAECCKSPADIRLEGAFDIRIKEHQIRFRIPSDCLNQALKSLTDYEITAMNCEPPALEELFMHYYKKEGEV